MLLIQVAVYVPGSKGAPSFVRLYQYPNFGGPQSALANKSFFKADKVVLLWNSKGIAHIIFPLCHCVSWFAKLSKCMTACSCC